MSQYSNNFYYVMALRLEVQADRPTVSNHTHITILTLADVHVLKRGTKTIIKVAMSSLDTSISALTPMQLSTRIL